MSSLSNCDDEKESNFDINFRFNFLGLRLQLVMAKFSRFFIPNSSPSSLVASVTPSV